MTSPLKLRFLKEAAQEIVEISEWYGERSPRARERFLDELDEALGLILEAPERWPSHLHGTRRLLLRKFPFGVIYRLAEPWAEIVAVAHHKRRRVLAGRNHSGRRCRQRVGEFPPVS